MGKSEEMEDIEYVELDDPDEELKFILWKAELNKELVSFWKSISK